MLIKAKPKKFWRYQPSWGKAAAGAATTTWNPLDKAALVTLSPGNLTASYGGSSGYQAVRSIASHSSGKLYCEFTIVHDGSNSDLGIENGSQSLSAPVGDSNLGIQYQPNNGQIVSNFSVIATIQTATNGDIVCMAVDLSASLFWIRTNGGNWNNSGTADPSTGAGGKSFSLAGGPYFAAWAGHDPGPPVDEVTANFGATAYAQAAPSGFGNW